MKQFLLAAFLIAAPIALFAGYRTYMGPPSAPVQVAEPSLGDLTGLKAIAADTGRIAESGDLAAAERRITDFETAWDDAEPTMRPLNALAWAAIDGAADGAIGALRAGAPDPRAVKQAVADLLTILENPYGAVAPAGGIVKVSGVAITDETGHPLPCEDMLRTLKAAFDEGRVAPDKQAPAKELQAKAIERCNADDDRQADEFAAQALALADK